MIVEKVVTAKDGYSAPLPETFSFAFSKQTIAKKSIDIATTGESVATSSIAVAAGALTITEAANEDYKLQDATCTVDGKKKNIGTLSNRSLNLTVPATGAVLCTFTNAPVNKPPTLIVEKVVTAIDGYSTPLPETFAFTFGKQTIAKKSIEITATEEYVATASINVSAGALTITEGKNNNYSLQDASCTVDGKTSNISRLTGRTLGLNVPKTGDVLCTFTNKPANKPPTLIVEKLVTAVKGFSTPLPETFSFAFGKQTIAKKSIKITATEEYVATSSIKVSAGPLTITEGKNEDYNLQDASCTVDGKALNIGKLTGRTLRLNVPKTGDVLCTFTNKPANKPPTLIVEKVVTAVKGFSTPLPQTFGFAFDVQTIASKSIKITATGEAVATSSIKVAAGPLIITEGKNEDYELQTASCTVDGKTSNISSLKNRTLRINVPKTGDVRCTFTNVPINTPPTLIVEKIVGGPKSTAPFANHTFKFAVGTSTVSIPVSARNKTFSSAPITVPANGSIIVTEFATANYNIDADDKRLGCRVVDGVGLVGEFDATQRGFAVNLPKTGEVRCTFVNVSPPTLIVEKLVTAVNGFSTPLPQTFGFAFGGQTIAKQSINITATGKTVASPLIKVSAGTLTITEGPNEDYKLQSASCKVDGQTATFGTLKKRALTLKVPKTGAVQCTFTNAPVNTPPTLIVKKLVTAVKGFSTPLPQTFGFAFSGQKIAKQSIKITETGKSVATPLIKVSAGTLTITEAANEDYKLQSANCKVDGQTATFGTLKKRALTLKVPKTGAVQCTFTNAPVNTPPTLIVEKLVTAVSGFSTPLPQTFGFAFGGQTIAKQSINITATGKTVATPLIKVSAGTLTITEGPNEDYKLQSANCKVDGQTATFGTLKKRALTLKVPKTGAVQCTFTNVPTNKPPTLIIEKVVEGGGTGTFSFNFDKKGLEQQSIKIDSSEANKKQTKAIVVAAAATIKITEILTTDFTFKGAVCTSGGKELVRNASGATAAAITVTMPKTGEVVCTFTNLTVPKPPPPGDTFADVIIKKVTEGGNSTFAFTVKDRQATVPQSITTAELKGQTETIRVLTGPVTITEIKHGSFKFVSVACDSGQPKPSIKDRNVTITAGEGDTITCTFRNKEVGGRTISIISNFLYRRAQQLLGDTGRPRLVERRENVNRGGSLKDSLGVDGSGSLKDGAVGFRTSLKGALGDNKSAKAERFGIRASDYGIQTRIQKHRTGWDVWTEGRMNYFRSDATYDGSTTSGHFGLVRIGTDYLVAPRFLVGFLAQYDSIDEDNGGGPDGYRISGTGFMMGPYAEYQFSKGLYFDAKVLWGQSTNDISPFNTYTDSFGTTRWLAAARLTGSWDYQITSKSVLHFSPRAEFAYFSETSDSYADSNDINIAGQEVNLGRLTVGPEVSYRHITKDGMRIEPRLAVKGLWSFGNGDPKGLDPAFSSSVSKRKVDRFGMQFSGGLVIEAPSGIRLDVQGDYTGRFGDGEELSVGGKVNITVPLQAR